MQTFFVGSAEWGVRLNEVAYGCGVDYRARVEDGSGRLVDDAPSIARILREGMSLCHSVAPAKTFLDKVGAQGLTYAEMAVFPLPRPLKPRMPANMLRAGSDENAEECAVPEEMCKTMKSRSGIQDCFSVAPGRNCNRITNENMYSSGSVVFKSENVFNRCYSIPGHAVDARFVPHHMHAPWVAAPGRCTPRMPPNMVRAVPMRNGPPLSRPRGLLH